MITTEAIKQFIRNHPRIDLIQYIVRKKIYNAQKCRQLLEMDKSPMVVQYNHFGDYNKGRLIYHIKIDSAYQAMGYCSLLRVTLLHLAYADRMSLEPVIEWTRDLLYSEEEKIGSTDNSFEYFFCNTSHFFPETVYKSDMVAVSKIYDINLLIEKLSYEADEAEINILAEMIKKYLSFNDNGKKEIEVPCKKQISSRSVLGVHVRGTDFSKGYSRHPIMVSVDEYLKEAEKAFCENDFDYVFLATDEQAVIGEFRKVFGKKLLYYESLRSEDGKPLHYGTQKERKNNKYMLGLEILKDVYTLGNCDGLVAGCSNVSIIAEAIKKSTGSTYSYRKIINKGINYNLKECSLSVRNR